MSNSAKRTIYSADEEPSMKRCGGMPSQKRVQRRNERQFASIQNMETLKQQFGINFNVLLQCWENYFKRHNMTGSCQTCGHKISGACPFLNAGRNRKSFVYHDVPHAFFVLKDGTYNLSDAVELQAFMTHIETLTKKQKANLFIPICHECFDVATSVDSYYYSISPFVDSETGNIVKRKKSSIEKYVSGWCEKSHLCQTIKPNGHRCCKPTILGRLSCQSCRTKALITE